MIEPTLDDIEQAISGLHFPVMVCDVRSAPADAVYVGRAMPNYANARIAPELLSAIHAGSPLHNPYKAAAGRERALVRFGHHFAAHVDQEPMHSALAELVTRVLNQGSVTLACWCAEFTRPAYRDPTEHADGCHADVIAFAVDLASQSIRTRLEAEATDDLFAHIRRAPRSTDRRITCRACSAFVRVPLDHPALLCPSCLADLAATRQRLIDRGQAVLAAWGAEWDAWRFTEASLNGAALTRWNAIKDAQARGLTPAEQARIDAIATDATDPLAALLRLTRNSQAERYADQINAITAGLKECEAAR